jgi:hypothetical protein
MPGTSFLPATASSKRLNKNVHKHALNLFGRRKPPLAALLSKRDIKDVTPLGVRAFLSLEGVKDAFFPTLKRPDEA